jgi:hypothetical protein
MAKELGTQELSELLVDAIINEPFFSKKILVPKLNAIISAHRVKLSTINYNKIESPSELAKMIRAEQIQYKTATFWKRELRKLVGEEGMIEYYDKFEKERLMWEGLDSTQNN